MTEISRTLLAMLEQHVAPTYVLNGEGIVILWNRACAAFTGVEAVDVLGSRNHWKAFHASKRPCLADLVLHDTIEWVPEYYVAYSDSAFAKGALAVESWCDLPNGRRVYMSGDAGPIYGDDGALIGVMETIRDLTAMKTAEAQLRDLAGLDGLTGLSNRRTFDNVLGREWARASRNGDPLALLLFDIDRFKQFNDNFGHAGGDQCLSEVAKTMARAVHRAGDLPARYGGEEFAIVLPSTDMNGALTIAEIVRSDVENRCIRHPENTAGPFVTVSAGAASVFPARDRTTDEIVRCADAALYRAKELGRNRVCAFDERSAPALRLYMSAGA